MKKLLALVLALVMTLSLCVTSNAAFTDAKDVDADFEEAVAVLSGMGVFKGYEDGSFKPEGNITRAEVAAIVYRLYTGDVKDKQAGLYAGYGKFDDMAGAQWAAGYVGFCANAGFVKGYGNGKFGPSDPVTGYQALAMILRAVGYGKNGEFEGADWELHVAQVAQQLKVLKNVKNTSLKAAASRQLVAELLFQVAANVDTVTYTPAFGYVSDKFTADGKDIETETLGEKNFDLTKVEDQADDWGRPQYKWTNGKSGDKKVTYATIKDKPVATYTEAVAQCDIFDELDLTKGKNDKLAFVLNGNGKDNDEVTVEDKSAKADFTKQGRLVEIYDVTGEKNDYDQFKVVAIDTYLAKVGTVLELKLDKNDHVERDASLTMTVYTSKAGTKTVKLTDDEANFEYEKDDMVLVNINDKDVTKSVILGVADTVEGKATKFSGSKNNAADTVFVGDEEYTIAFKYFFDECGKDGKSTYTWYVDQYGNVIGNELLKTVYSYAVLKNLNWVPAKAGGHAEADLIYFDGTVEEGVVVDTIDGFGDYNGWWDMDDPIDDAVPEYHASAEGTFDEYNEYPYDPYVSLSDEGKNNDWLDGYAMYRVDTDEDGEVTLDMFEITGTYRKTIDKLDFVYASEGSINLDTGKMTGYAYWPALAGESTGDYYSSKIAVADKDTKFIYCDEDEDEEEYVFTAYTLEDLPEFVDGTVGFMAKVDDDGVAEYVYIFYATEAGDQYDFFMPTSDVWTYDAKEKTYTIVGILDGEEEQKVTFDADIWGVAELTAKDKANAVGKLFKIWTDEDGDVNTEMVLVNTETDMAQLEYVDLDELAGGYAFYVFDKDAQLLNDGKLYEYHRDLYDVDEFDFYITNETVVLGTEDMTLAEAVDANTDDDDGNDVGVWFVIDSDEVIRLSFAGEDMFTESVEVKYVYIGEKLADTANVTVDIPSWFVKETKTVTILGKEYTQFTLKDDFDHDDVWATVTVDNGGYFGEYSPFYSRTFKLERVEEWFMNDCEYKTEDGVEHNAPYIVFNGVDHSALTVAELPDGVESVTVLDADGAVVATATEEKTFRNKLLEGATYTVVLEAEEGYKLTTAATDNVTVTFDTGATNKVSVEEGVYTFVAPLHDEAVTVTVTAAAVAEKSDVKTLDKFTIAAGKSVKADMTAVNDAVANYNSGDTAYVVADTTDVTIGTVGDDDATAVYGIGATKAAAKAAATNETESNDVVSVAAGNFLCVVVTAEDGTAKEFYLELVRVYKVVANGATSEKKFYAAGSEAKLTTDATIPAGKYAAFTVNDVVYYVQNNGVAGKIDYKFVMPAADVTASAALQLEAVDGYHALSVSAGSNTEFTLTVDGQTFATNCTTTFGTMVKDGASVVVDYTVTNAGVYHLYTVSVNPSITVTGTFNDNTADEKNDARVTFQMPAKDVTVSGSAQND